MPDRTLSTLATWFVTGASRGFGRELTEQLLARGDRVAATLALAGRLAAVEAQKDLAAATDVDGWPADG